MSPLFVFSPLYVVVKRQDAAQVIDDLQSLLCSALLSKPHEERYSPTSTSDFPPYTNIMRPQLASDLATSVLAATRPQLRQCTRQTLLATTSSRQQSNFTPKAVQAQGASRGPQPSSAPSTTQTPATARSEDATPDTPLRSLTEGLADPPPVLNEDEKQVDWTRSFHGISSSPFSEEQAAVLMQELNYDDIEIKPDGIVYLPEIKYRRILNKAFGPGGWGLVPRGETIVTGKVVTREYGLVAGGR